MKLRAISLIVLLGAALFMAACDSQTPPPTGPTPTISGPDPGPGGGATLTYATTGGIAGVRRELTITPQGLATLVDGDQTFGPVTLPAERMTEIRTKLTATNFKELNERYGSGTVSDDFEHTLTVAEGGSTKSVTVEEIGGKDVTPQAVQELFALMAQVEEQVRELAATYKGKITYKATREVTGQNWEMTITESGEATIMDGGQVIGKVQLSAERMAQIESLFESANFFNLKAFYGSGSLGPNERINTLTLQTPEKTKVVTMEEVGSFNQTTPQMENLFRTIYNTLVGARVELLGTPTTTP